MDLLFQKYNQLVINFNILFFSKDWSLTAKLLQGKKKLNFFTTLMNVKEKLYDRYIIGFVEAELFFLDVISILMD